MKDLFSDETIEQAAATGLPDEPDFSTPTRLPEVDRSTLEAYGTCPAQGVALETGVVRHRSHAMEVGNEVHAAFSAAVDEYIIASQEITDRLYPSMIVDAARGRLLQSRPDLQHDAIKAAERSLWTWAKMLFSIMPGNILAYDGPPTGDKRCGQLGWDLPQFGICVASELDLLYAGPSPTLLHEVDYKSGWGLYTETSVAASFQFQLHAALVFENYPTVEALDVSVLNTRVNEFTKPVRFERERLPQYQARILTTVAARDRNKGKPFTEAEVWPNADKCPLCPARAICPGIPPCPVESDPAAFITSLYTLQSVVDARIEQATEYVDRTGADITAPGGIYFGRRKPVRSRSNPAVFYSLESKEK